MNLYWCLQFLKVLLVLWLIQLVFQYTRLNKVKIDKRLIASKEKVKEVTKETTPKTNKSSKLQNLDSNKLLLKLTDSLEGLVIEHRSVLHLDDDGTTSIRLTKSIINQGLRIKELVEKIIEKQVKSINWVLTFEELKDRVDTHGNEWISLFGDSELFLIPSKDAIKGQNDTKFLLAASLAVKNQQTYSLQRELGGINYNRLHEIKVGLEAIGVTKSLPVSGGGKVLVSNEVELKRLLKNIYPAANIKEEDLYFSSESKFLIRTILRKINFIKNDTTCEEKLGVEEFTPNSEVLVSSFQELDKFVNKLQPKLEKIKKNHIIDRDQLKLQLINEFDKDSNDKIDIIECDDFNQLLKKYQKKIIEIDKIYIQQFVQLSEYLNTKKDNIQHLYDKVKAIPNQNAFGSDYNDFFKIIKNAIHCYKVLLANSLNMICAIIEDDLITFYKIHGKLDKLNIFNSNYENEVLNKLSNIELKLQDVIYSINDMNNNLVMELGMLSMEIENSTNILSNHLEEIGSNINANTFLAGIGVYQMYQINKNTKSLN